MPIPAAAPEISALPPAWDFALYISVEYAPLILLWYEKRYG
jgi:hypothetical protein